MYHPPCHHLCSPSPFGGWLLRNSDQMLRIWANSFSPNIRVCFSSWVTFLPCLLYKRMFPTVGTPQHKQRQPQVVVASSGYWPSTSDCHLLPFVVCPQRMLRQPENAAMKDMVLVWEGDICTCTPWIVLCIFAYLEGIVTNGTYPLNGCQFKHDTPVPPTASKQGIGGKMNYGFGLNCVPRKFICWNSNSSTSEWDCWLQAF